MYHIYIHIIRNGRIRGIGNYDRQSIGYGFFARRETKMHWIDGGM